MIAGTFLLGASALGFMLIDSAGLLAAVLRGCQGIAWSLTFAAGMSLVADVAPPERARARHRPLRGRGARHQRARTRDRGADRDALRRAPAVPAVRRDRRWSGPGIAAGCSAGAAASAPTSAAKPAAGAARSRAIVIGVLAIGSLAAATVSTFVAPFALTHGIALVRGFFITYTLTALAVRIGATRLVDRLGHRNTAFAGAAGYGLVMIALATVGSRAPHRARRRVRRGARHRVPGADGAGAR